MMLAVKMCSKKKAGKIFSGFASSNCSGSNREKLLYLFPSG